MADGAPEDEEGGLIMGSTAINWTARRRIVPGPQTCAHDATGEDRCLDTTCPRCWEPGYTCNPWDGCVEKTEACAHCYAKVTAENRHGLDVWGKNKPRKIRVNEAVRELRTIDRRAARTGQRIGVFSLSMGDIFEDHPMLGAPRATYLAAAEKAEHVDLMLLTKRPENIAAMAPAGWMEKWPKHVWMGATIASPGEERFADYLAPLRERGAITFASVEPMIGDGPAPGAWLRHLSLVIPGGESGGGSRSFNVDAAHRLVDVATAAGVKVWFKQMGSRWASETGRGLLRKGASHGQDPYRWPEWARRRELPVTEEAPRG